MRARQLFTVGYEGKTVAEFIDALVDAGVRRVIDVRELPLSRRRGFSKTKLSEALGMVGIEYIHVRDAGNPHRSMKADVERCLQLYKGHLDDHPEVVEELAELASSKKTALLCVEADPERCHRSVLVERMSSTTTMRVQHL